ncbi:hypothetical protein K439DRAFT_1538890 [Ramaria rubella]|nr:hypothetical protein K439DRAFT_1538890 [Ramaria rubella]
MYLPKEESNSNVDGLPCVFSLIGETVKESEEEDVDKSGLPCQIGQKRPYAAVADDMMEDMEIYRCIQLSSLFRKGLNAKQAEYAVKKYRSHCSVGPSIMMSLGIMDNPS